MTYVNDDIKYQQIFFVSPAPMIIVDSASGDIIDVNQSAIDYYGYSYAEFQNMKIYDINTAEPSFIKKKMKEVNRSKTFLFKHRLKNKEIRDVEVFSGLINIDGRTLINSIIIDVTDKMQAEALLKNSENKLKDFARAIPDVSAIVDEDGRYIDVFGDNRYQLFPPDLADVMLEDIRQVIKTGETRSMIREFYVGSEKRYFEGRTAPMQYLIDGKKTAVVVVSDITECLEVNKILKFTYEVQRKSDFIHYLLIGNLSYDEKTIIMASELGIEFSKPLFCCLISLRESDGRNSEGITETDHLKKQMNQLIYLLSSTTQYFIWDNRDRIGVLCQEVDFQNMWEHSMRIAMKIKDLITRAKPDLHISIGISEVHSGTGSIKKSYQEALNAQISALCQEQPGGSIYHYKDIGLSQILTSIYGKDFAQEFVQKMIGPLIEYDFEKGTNLRISLEEILQSNNLKDAAQKLFIHHKTLVFRKHRVEKILGVSLDNPDTRLALAAAIKLYKLINMNQSTIQDSGK